MIDFWASIWDRYRALTEDLEMPGRARKLADRFDELSEYYDQMATEKLSDGIRLFAKDLVALRDLVKKELQLAAA